MTPNLNQIDQSLKLSPRFSATDLESDFTLECESGGLYDLPEFLICNNI